MNEHFNSSGVGKAGSWLAKLGPLLEGFELRLDDRLLRMLGK